MTIEYDGWELHYFDEAYNFRTYQFKIINQFVKGKTAEVGPGTGENTNYYLHKTASLDLFEPSKKIFEILKEKIQNKPNVQILNKEFLNHKEKYDTIIYLDVLEHIEHDQEEFFNAFSNLNEGGYLIVSVPAFNFLYSKFDKDVGHCKRYSKTDFKKFIKQLKPSFSKLIYYDSVGFLLIVLSRIFFKSEYSSNIKNKVSFWNKLIPISKIIDLVTFFSFGKSLLCIIKK
tara:strand:+ start:1965 stop:2654 length:690 start_codon:yes stop_codon:yes gene_type:complete